MSMTHDELTPFECDTVLYHDHDHALSTVAPTFFNSLLSSGAVLGSARRNAASEKQTSFEVLRTTHRI